MPAPAEAFFGLAALGLTQRLRAVGEEKERDGVLALGFEDRVRVGTIAELADYQAGFFEHFPLCAGFQRLAEL